MKRVFLLVALGLATFNLCVRGFAATPLKPNFIFILVDDLGWTDLGVQGSKFYETPNIDRLASQGMRFTQAYSACTVCSPTRAALLTGKYPARLHITDWIKGHVRPDAKLKVPDWTMHLPLEETTIAEALKHEGYATASIGKWHLGGSEFYPDKQGFDENLAGNDRGQPPSYFSPYGIPTLADGHKGEFLSDRLTDETLKFIERNKTKPFFIYLPHYAVHTPLMGKPEVIAKYKRKADPQNPQHNPVYAALIESVDDSVGRILQKLDELKLAENTVVIFTSDNGGLLQNDVTSNLPLRAGKGSAYEGGVRVPLFIKWPGITKPGSTCDTPAITPDYFPTMLDMAGLAAKKPRSLDGESLVPLLKQTGGLRKTIFWHYPHYHPGGATPYSAIRDGDWKLIEFFEDNHVELYNLREDIGEQSDLATKLPDRANALRKKLHAWRTKVGAQLPTANPDYDAKQMNSPAKAK
ncbi:MAG: sulfatase [Verrucomicrobia bacterium]|nr:sulfatase [Verrucomicrobiota bacterium]